jgi:hypothetical protein
MMDGLRSGKNQTAGVSLPTLAPARWLLLAILAAAPWAYGCILWWIIPWFTGALLVTLALWTGGLMLRRRGPTIPLPLFGLAGWLAVHGWLLVVNVGYYYDRQWLRFVEVKPSLATWLPGAIDAANAFPMMLRMTGLLGVLLVAADAARQAKWRGRLFWIIVVSGTLLVVYGLLQRMSPVPLLFWERADLNHNLFATFYYHGNAGAFVNLLLPFVFGAAVYGFAPTRSPAMRSFGAAALFLNVAAAAAIASKAAQLVTVALLVASAVVYRREILLLSGFGSRERNAWLIFTVLGVLCMGTLALTADTALRRWELLPRLLNSENSRLLAYTACLRMLPDAGFWGIGPGNFPIAFPHYTNGLPEAIMGVWTYAHEDYIQTVIEWGWLGAAAWAALFFGAWQKGWAQMRRSEAKASFSPEDSLIYRSAFLAVSGVALHSLVDFPLQIGSIQVYVMTMIGLLWQWPAFFRKNAQTKSRKSARRFPDGKASDDPNKSAISAQ